MSTEQNRPNKLTGLRVLITKGKYAGREGLCVGPAEDRKRWAISPDGTDEIALLGFDEEFGLLIDLSNNPQTN